VVFLIIFILLLLSIHPRVSLILINENFPWFLSFHFFSDTFSQVWKSTLPCSLNNSHQDWQILFFNCIHLYRIFFFTTCVWNWQKCFPVAPFWMMLAFVSFYECKIQQGFST
jgi:hypothetical protein